MAESENLRKTSLHEIEFCMLEESRFEEFRLNINQWWATADNSRTLLNFIDFPRLTEEDFYCIADDSVMFIACLKGTNEMVGTSGLENPKISQGKSTSEIILGAVKPEYRQFGIGKRLIDKAIELAKQMGIERVVLVTNFYKKHLTQMVIKKDFTLTGTIVEHKSSYTKTFFLATQDYRVYNRWIKSI